MFKNRTYREKLRLLLFGAGAFLILAYWLSLSKTVHAFRENNLLESRLDSVQSAPTAIARYTAELEGYERSLGRFSAGNRNWEEHLLQGIGKACQQYGAVLIEFPAPLVEVQTSYTVLTHAVKLEGSYKALVQVVYALERMEAVGRITSVRFALEEDRRSRSTRLFGYVYFQHIKRES